MGFSLLGSAHLTLFHATLFSLVHLSLAEFYFMIIDSFASDTEIESSLKIVGGLNISLNKCCFHMYLISFLRLLRKL